jgi:monoamine oxidase
MQAKSKFWADDHVSPNMNLNDPQLYNVWKTGDEVNTTRGLLAATASGPGTVEQALATFRKYYPGKSENIEKVKSVVWATDPWRSACETTSYKPGELSRFWPSLIEPLGRLYFVGAYADNLNWGMEAGTRSANRVAEAIDKT